MEKKSAWRFWLIGIVLFFTFLYMIKSILLPFVVGMLLAYFLDPAADKLESWGFSRLLATAGIIGAFFLALVLAGIALIPTLADQFSGLVNALPDTVSHLQAHVQPLIDRFIDAIPPEQAAGVKTAAGNGYGTLLAGAGEFFAGLLKSGMAVVNALSLVFITPVVAFYLLKDWDRIVAKIDRLLPLPYADTIRMQVREIDRTLAGFVRGQALVCMMLAAFYGIGLSAAGLKFGMAVGLLTGVLVIVPYVGLLFGMTLGVSLALFQFDDMARVGLVLAVFILGQIIEGNFITPKLVGEKVGLHPVWIIFGLLAGGALFGFVGIFIAVPVTAVIGVLVRFAVSRYVSSPLYRGHATPPTLHQP